MRKSISVIITIAMLISMLSSFSFTAGAATWESTITPTEPSKGTVEGGASAYLITNAAEFMWLKTNNTTTAYLAADIVLGTKDNPFTAPFEFKGQLIGTETDSDKLHTITAYINNTAGTSTGLFSVIDGATIKNIKIAGSITSTGNNTGALAGEAKNTDTSRWHYIENCINTATVIGKQNTAGFVGSANTNRYMYVNLKNKGEIKGTDRTGGLIGLYSNGKIINCANLGIVESSTSYAGGIAAAPYYGIIYNCYNNGSVFAKTQAAGGIAGFAGKADACILHCFNAGAVSSTNGNAAGILALTALAPTVVACYNVGSVVSTSGKTGAIVAPNNNTDATTANVSECRYLAGQTYTITTGATSFEKADNYELASWKISDAALTAVAKGINNSFPVSDWVVAAGYDYPQLATNPYETLYKPAEMTGDEGDGFVIDSEKAFMWLKENPTVTAYVTKDFTIGTSEAPFTAPFEFKGKLIGTNKNELPTITVNIKNTAGTPTGLFSVIDSATIRNIKIAGSVTSTGSSVGAFAGESKNTDTSKWHYIENCINAADVKGVDNVGGFVGNANTNRYNYVNNKNIGNVNGSSKVGGIIGTYLNGKLMNSGNTGNITGTSLYVGGIAGVSYYGPIYNTYNSGKVQAKSHAGGISGFGGKNEGLILQCFNTGKVSTTNGGSAAGILAFTTAATPKVYTCYNIGSITSSGNTGAIVGIADGAEAPIAIIQECRYLAGQTYTTTNGAAPFEYAESYDLASWKITDALLGTLNNVLSNLYPASDWVMRDGYDYPQLATVSYDVVYEPAEMTGAEGAGYVIDSEKAFMWLKENPTVTAYVTKDFTIGSKEAPFTTPFEFNGKLIGTDEENLKTITAYITTNGGATGLFSTINAATIKNICMQGEITNTVVPENAYGSTGSLAGFANGKITVKNIVNKAAVTSHGYAAGIIGATQCANGVISDAVNYGDITISEKNFVAGITTYSSRDTYIANCANYGKITNSHTSSGTGYAAGIIADLVDGTVYNCYNAGDISAATFTGGVAARIRNAAILRSYNVGSVKNTSASNAKATAGGIVATVYTADSAYNVVNCYNAGTLSDRLGKAYPIMSTVTFAGVATTAGSVSGCYYLKDADDENTYAGATAFENVTEADLENWNKADISSVTIPAGYPEVSAWVMKHYSLTPLLETNLYTVKEDGTEENPYLIYDRDSFMNISANPTAYYKLIKDIDLGEYVPFAFSGSLVADELTSINININLPENDYVGLFTKLDNPIKVKNINITGTVVGNCYAGGIAGAIELDDIADKASGVVVNCTNNANVEAKASYAGGLIGGYENVNSDYSFTAETKMLVDCVNYGDVVSGMIGAGGIIGVCPKNAVTITRLTNYGTVTGVTNVGGISGNVSGNLTYSANYGDVSGKECVGGVVGVKASRTILGCYNVGNVNAYGTRVGGVLGYLVNANVQSCYNAGNVVNTSAEYPAGSIVGGVNTNGAGKAEIKYSYNVGVINNTSKTKAVHPLYGEDIVNNGNESTKNIAFDASCTLSPDGESEYEKTLEEMLAYNPGSAYQAPSSDNAYPFAQFKTTLGTTANNVDFDVYLITVTTTGEGVSSETGKTYANSNGGFRVVFTPDEGYEIANNTVKVNGEDCGIENGVLVIDKIASDITVSAEFTVIPLESEEVIQETVNSYGVSYFRPIILENSTITSGVDENGNAIKFTLTPGVNYAIVMSQGGEFNGYKLVDYGFVVGSKYCTAKPYIYEEDGGYGVLFYGDAVKSGAEVLFKPYIKLDKISTEEVEEITFIGTGEIVKFN